MVKFFFLLVNLSIWNSLLSQNLLTNGDFENNIGAGYGKVENAQSWKKVASITRKTFCLSKIHVMFVNILVVEALETTTFFGGDFEACITKFLRILNSFH